MPPPTTVTSVIPESLADRAMFRAMGRRGVSHHARGTKPALAKGGLPYTVIARNRSWTTFAVIGDADIELLAARIGTPIMQIWSDDDHGSQIKVATPDGWSGELLVAIDDAELSDSDKTFLEELATRGVLTAAKHMALLIGLPIHVARRELFEKRLVGVGELCVVDRDQELAAP